MITREGIARHILSYLNGITNLAELVRWAEDTLVEVSEYSADDPDAAAKMRILGYIGAGDTDDFPLTWEILSSFLRDLNTQVRVVQTAA